MELEHAQTITLGTRCYRKYPLKIEPPPLKSQFSVDILYDDDEDSGVDAMPVNDKGNYEDLLQELEEDFRPEDAPQTTLLETIFYDPRYQTYTARLRINQNTVFYQLFGKVASNLTEQQRYIETASGAVLKPMFKDLTVEIRASQAVSTARAHAMLLDAMKKAPELRPTEYQVVDERSRKVIGSYRPQDLGTVQPEAMSVQTEEKLPTSLPERPEIQIKKDNKRNRFSHFLCNFPDICTKVLLKDSGSVLKQLRQELNHRCDMFVNKQHRRLEFSASTEEDVRAGYALIIRTFNAIPECVSALSNPVKGYTHFLAMSFQHDPALVPAVQMIVDCEIPNVGLITPPGKLHVTMGLLTLETGEAVEQAKEVIRKVLENRENAPLPVHFSRLNCFGKPTAATVLYLEPEDSVTLQPLKQVNFQLLQALVQAGLFPESELKAQHFIFDPAKFSATYHLTLVKVVKGRGRAPPMDIRNALAKTTTVDVTAYVRKLGLYEISTGVGEEYRPVYEVDINTR